MWTRLVLAALCVARPPPARAASPQPGAGAGGECGWGAPQLSAGAVSDAAFGEFPWAVYIMQKSKGKELFGGGVLIHPAAVVSVAHKFKEYQDKPQEITVRAGEWNTQATNETYPHQERTVKKIIIHPEYFRMSLYYDVALLVLGSPLELAGAPHVRPACLGARLPPPGTVCYSMGWSGGAIYESSDVLMKFEAPLVGVEDCENMMRRTRLGDVFALHSSLTCAGGQEGVDTCGGDGGSSLVCPIATAGERTRYAVVGLVAYGIGCGERRRPGLFVNVPATRDWLDRAMREEHFATDTYKE